MTSEFAFTQNTVDFHDLEDENKKAIFDWVTKKERKARLIVDKAMMLVWANGPAWELLTHGSPIALADNGTVIPRLEALRGRIEQAMRSPVEESLFVIEGSDDIGSDLLVRLERLPESGGKGHFGLQLIRHAPTADGWSETLARHFQLTPKQTEVLTRMISGESGEDIARAMRISVETVRTHVRDVYAKLRVSSREELFVRVRPFYM